MTAGQNKAALSYHTVRGLYFPAFMFAETIVNNKTNCKPISSVGV